MNRKWWKEAVVYQIYPRSFLDTNGDGIGDLPGIIKKLDYLKELGIDVIWLSPVYKSPNADNGYDISDYYSIMKEFGTIKDMDKLINEAHRRDIKIIMDLVVNHTSDEHPWFIESRKSRVNPYRDFYFWRKGKHNSPPNNWKSRFGGSAWEYDQLTEEYYLHLFAVKQPDLNWDNPEVREKIYRMMEWWLDKGIDGFRMDVINMISKTEGLPDGNTGVTKIGCEHYLNGPRVHQYIREMNEKVLSRYDIMTVGETPGVTPEEALKYIAEDRKELNMLFHFEHMGIDRGRNKWEKREWSLKDIKEIFSRWSNALAAKGWNSLYLSNHDQPRMVSRFGNDSSYREESAKMLATLLHTLPGTPFIYQGEEIGMTNVAFKDINDYQDIETLNWYREMKEKGHPERELLAAIYRQSRDNARTPMQWSNRPQAGFTTGKPWLKMNPNYRDINVAKALDNQDSIFYYYQKLIQLRKDNPVFVYGDYQLILEDHQEIYSYLRTLEDSSGQTKDQLLVILNFFDQKPVFRLPAEVNKDSLELLISNYPVEDNNLSQIVLRPYEARVYRLLK